MSDKSRRPLAIIVMGVTASGKSTLGAELSRALACPFLEGDAFHAPEAIEKMRSGHPLTDEDRWPWLDRVGAAVKAAAAASGVAVAACSALKKAYRERLKAAIGFPVAFVLLQADPDELKRRISNRPAHYMPPNLLASQLDTLEPPQPGERVLTLDAQQSPPVLRDQALDWLRTNPR